MQLGKWLMLAGAGLLLAGGLLWLAGKAGLPLGKLPGDLRFSRGNFEAHFPIVTCIVLSVVITLLLNILPRLFK